MIQISSQEFQRWISASHREVPVSTNVNVKTDTFGTVSSAHPNDLRCPGVRAFVFAAAEKFIPSWNLQEYRKDDTELKWGGKDWKNGNRKVFLLEFRDRDQNFPHY